MSEVTFVSRVREAIRALGGSATERRRGCDAARDALSSDSLQLPPDLLTDLLAAAHEAALKECEKTETARFANIEGQFSSLLCLVVSRAIKNRCFINCEKILNCAFEVFKCSRFTRVFGNTYMSILYKYVLFEKYYLEQLKPLQYADLLDICVEVCGHTNVDLLNVSRLIAKIIEEGSFRCHLVLPIRDNLISITNLYNNNDVLKKDSIQETFLEIAILIVKRITGESRLAVCVFTESIMPHVLKYYDQTSVGFKMKKKLLFRFLRISIRIHHPKGRIGNVAGSLAGDWNVWNNLLKSIHQLISAESIFINQLFSKNINLCSISNEVDLYKDFIKTAVDICHQIFHTDVKADVDDESTKCKRFKSESYNFSSLSLTLSCLIQYSYPWIDIIREYVLKYEHSLTENDKINILQKLIIIIDKDISALEENSLYESIFILCKAINVNALKEQIDLVKMIWNNVLRKSSVPSNSLSKFHSIIQLFLDETLIPSPSEDILKLYHEKTMPFSTDSIISLNILLKRHNINVCTEKTRIQIAEWILNNFISVEYNVCIPLALFRLCVKENNVSLDCDYDNNITDDDFIFKNIFEDLESFLLTSDFETDLLISKTNGDHSICGEFLPLSVWKTVHHFILKTLLSNINNMNSKCNETNKFIPNILININIVLCYISFYLNLHLVNFSADIDDVKTQIINTLKIINDLLPTYFHNICHNKNEGCNILNGLKNMYSQKYNNDIVLFIREMTPKETVEFICNLLNHKESESQSFDLVQMDANNHTEIIPPFKSAAVDILLSYNHIRSLFSDEIINFILQFDLYNFETKNEFDTAVLIISCFLKYPQENIPLSAIFQFMQKICQTLFRDNNASFIILSLLYKMLGMIDRCDSKTMRDNCIIMLQSYLKRCWAHYYSPKTMGQALKCLSWIITYSNTSDWKKNLYEDLIKGLNSSLHCIRLYSCYCISVHVSKSSLKKVFEEFYSSLLELFTSDYFADLASNVLSDEGANRTAAVLHSLASISIMSHMWDKKSLINIFQVCYEKQININLQKKVLSLIAKSVNIPTTKELIMSNFNDLLHLWCKLNISIHKFPWSLLNCNTSEEFIITYRENILPVEWFYIKNVEKSEVFECIAKNNQISIVQVMNKCLPNLFIISLTSEFSKTIKTESGYLENNFKKVYGQCTCLPKEDVLQSLVQNNIDHILYGLINMVVDQNDFIDELQCDQSIPYSTELALSKAQFNAILKYFNDIFHANIIDYICIENPELLQKLLLNIWSDIETHHSLERRLLNLHRYWIILKILLLNSNENIFLTYFAIHSLLVFINKYECDRKFKELSIISCKVLFKVLKIILPQSSDIVKKLLPLLITRISSFAIKNQNMCMDSINIIQYIFNMEKEFGEILQTIDPLPDIAIFSKVNSLRKTHFLHDTNESINNCIELFLNNGTAERYQSLKIMHEKLLLHWDELTVMFTDLRSVRLFSEYCQASNLHNFMCSLLEITFNKQDENSLLEATRCLGKIGPADFQTLVLKLPFDYDYTSMPLECFIYVVFVEIKKYMFNENPIIIKAACKALKSILKFDVGKKILDILSRKPNNANIDKLMMPFLSKENIKLAPDIKILNPLFEAYLNRSEIWYEFDAKQHSQWIIDLTVSCLKIFSNHNGLFSDIVDICKLKSSISEKCFPVLLGLILSIASREQIVTIKTHIETFFKINYQMTYICTNDSKSQNIESQNSMCHYSKKPTKNFNKESIICMLQLVQFIRIQSKHYKFSRKSNYNIDILSFNYLPIAWAAYSTQAYFMAILFGELWCNDKMDNVAPKNPETIAKMPDGFDMLSVIRMSYQAIGDEDAVNGCGFSHFSNANERHNYYLSAKSYFDTLLLHDISLSVQGNTLKCDNSHELSFRNYAQSLHDSGLYYLAEKYIQHSGPNDDFEDIKYDCFWRLGDWGLDIEQSILKEKFDDTFTVDSKYIWSKQHYECLKIALEDINVTDFKITNVLKTARKYITFTYNQNVLESCQNMYQIAMKFQLVQEIEHFVTAKKSLDSCSNLISNWSSKNLIPFSDFKYIEPIFAQRILFLDCISNNPVYSKIKCTAVELILQYAELALTYGWIHISSRWISVASKLARKICDEQGMTKFIENLNVTVQLLEGRIAWSKGRFEIATYIVKNVISQNVVNIDNELYSKALMLYGTWMMETKRENVQDIFNNYLKLSLNVLGSNRSSALKHDVCFAISRFADEEYKQLDMYIKSPAFLNKIKFMEKCQSSYTALKEKEKRQTLSMDERKAKIFNEQQKNIDEFEIRNIQSEREQYLKLAMRYYLQSLSDGEEHDLCVFRVMSLWLNNPSLELDENSKRTIDEFFQSIPSRKFLLMIPQLAPRLNHKDKNAFQTYLYNIIKRCIIEHPHHTLPTLLALKHSYKDKDFKENTTSQSSKADSMDDTYVVSAEIMINSLRDQKQTKIFNIIKEMELLNLTMIKLANYKAEKSKMPKSKYQIPKTQSLCSLKSLSNIIVPTVTLPIDHTKTYHNIPSIASFSDSFELVGGINAPKKILCRGSDGIERNMLLKGEDDIRQDAVMQQVFGIVNNLLDKNRSKTQRHLIIRTYKIVVLSRRSGIIEWCDGTEPLGHLLVGMDNISGYHSKYRLQDITAKKAREMLSSKRHKSNEEKLIAFKEILSNFKPVFHYFFIENFLTPVIWYERRLAYMHSVATSSMTGYILGIGDRHVQNILVDKSTAEVIHIDFGIAFSQGRLQPTPETVPFRLTQDMVAGFGCCGIEGVFRKSCEKTMTILKSNQETLVTILEVLLYDPLYIWTISQEQAFKKQEITIPTLITSFIPNIHTHNNENSPSEAERALSQVRCKLEGAEFGSVLATSSQVSRLLQQATDANNLSRLFHGWQPYL